MSASPNVLLSGRSEASMSARSCAGFLAVVGGLLAALGGGRGRLSIDAASSVRYEEVKDWPALPAGVQRCEAPGVDAAARGPVLPLHRPGRGLRPEAREPQFA